MDVTNEPSASRHTGLAIDEVLETARALIANVLPANAQRRVVHDDDRLKDDLGIDSLALAAIAFSFERFGIELSRIAGIGFSSVNTVGDLLSELRLLLLTDSNQELDMGQGDRHAGIPTGILVHDDSDAR